MANSLFVVIPSQNGFAPSDDDLTVALSDLPEYVPAKFGMVDSTLDSAAVGRLMSTLGKLGVVVDLLDNGVYSFSFTAESKDNYFRDAYWHVRDTVSALTLEEFASNSFSMFNLKTSIENVFGDAVYDGQLKSLDTFVREAEIGWPYYIKCAYPIHYN